MRVEFYWRTGDLDNILTKRLPWVLSSAGRAAPLQGVGREFDPLSTHHDVLRSGSSAG